jgi:hypothetical protein
MSGLIRAGGDRLVSASLIESLQASYVSNFVAVPTGPALEPTTQKCPYYP